MMLCVHCNAGNGGDLADFSAYCFYIWKIARCGAGETLYSLREFWFEARISGCARHPAALWLVYLTNTLFNTSRRPADRIELG